MCPRSHAAHALPGDCRSDQPALKLATYNVNGINGRLPVLLRWLEEAKPDIVCLQELKAPQEKFPAAALRQRGYSAIWHGQKSWNGVAVLARKSMPLETRRGLPGDPEDIHSRYIESKVGALTVGCLYLPNGNPAPGPKFGLRGWRSTRRRCLRQVSPSCSPATTT